MKDGKPVIWGGRTSDTTVEESQPHTLIDWPGRESAWTISTPVLSALPPGRD
jgi:hypothetical protein